MDKYIIILLIAILVYGMIMYNVHHSNKRYEIYNENINEHFGTDLIKSDKEFHIKSLSDQFPNVVYYENDNLLNNVDGELGTEKCNKFCNGRCVEFGVTSNAWCFNDL